MKFLLDQNLSPGLVGLLEQAGHTASHVRDLDIGAFVVLDQDRVRVRSLPFRPDD